jgi:anti-sigma B factor antagonist
MPLSIEIQNNPDPRHAGAVTIKLSGSLDTATAPELDRQLTLCLAGRVNHLVFDLAELKFVSSAGLRLFQMARKQMVARGGGQASFVNMQPQVEEVFTIIQSLPGIGVFKDVEALDRYLATRPSPNVWPGTQKKTQPDD